MTKGVAFVLAVLLSGGIVWSAGMLALKLSVDGFAPDILFDKNQWMWQSMEEEHLRAAILYDDMRANRSEENIRAGKTVSDQEIINALYEDYLNDDDYSDNATQDKEERLTDKKLENLSDEIQNAVYDMYGEYNTDEIALFTAWLKENRIGYTIEKMILTQAAWEEWSDSQSELNRSGNYLYYAESRDNGFVSTNLEESRADAIDKIKSCPLVYQYDVEADTFSFAYDDSIAKMAKQYAFSNSFADVYEDNYATSEVSFDWGYYNTGVVDSSASNAMPSDAVILIGITQEALDSHMNTIDGAYRWGWSMVWVMGICTILLLLCCVILCSGAGRRSLDAPAERIRFDRIWTEVQVLFVGFVLVFGAEIAFLLFKNIVQSSVAGAAWFVLPAGVACVVAALCLPCLMSQARRVKTRSFWEGFVCFRAIRWLVRQWKQGPRYMRVISLAILVPLACAPWVTIPFVIAALLYFGVRQTKDLEAVMDGAHRIREGETGLHIEVKYSRDLSQLADDINGISDGLHSAVDTAVKSERLKSELISNVSHDLKTPLTGIVTYVDLMKQLEPDDPKMQEYLATVVQKTQRLSTLINDLLEASKASSGAMKLELTRVDFEALFAQACGEMQPKLDAAGLDIRSRTHGRTDVCADGRLLWRVLDNLLSNCARYAAPDSRVYTELREKDGFCVFTIKNISASELNIPADELMERFTRGDRARHTEGSGLGLSIARSLTERMHGRFCLTVDGDLFKAEVAIPLWDDVWEKTKPLGADFNPDATQRLNETK
ncbi:MAG: HAMP domain-containing sensor histidine kinase [Eubacteriales bacterium]|nr:HAMP domain-containing sensor histidine kinase [Eubacteriales bacterium]